MRVYCETFGCTMIGYEQNKRYLGRTMEGLVVEKGENGGYVVRLPNYKPAIIREGEIGNFVTVKITGAKPTYLLGEITNSGGD